MRLFSRLGHTRTITCIPATILFATLLASVMIAQAPEAQHFDVASVRLNNSGTAVWQYAATPGRLTVRNGQLEIILMNAFGIQRYQLITDQDWVRTERFDIEATSEKPATGSELSAMLQQLLADRFKLATHRETRNVPSWSLVVAGRPGPGLKRLENSTCVPQERRSTMQQGEVLCGATRMSTTWVRGARITMDSLAKGLAFVVGRPVKDDTGLAGEFDVDLSFVPDSEILANRNDTNGPSIMAAVQEQLGLKLQNAQISAEVLVIDHIERPSPN